MSRKEILKNEILLKMRFHLDRTTLSILDNILSECFYRVDIVDSVTLPATMNDSNDYILSLYELKRSLVLKESTMQGYMLAARELIRYVPKQLVAMDVDDINFYLRQKKAEGNSGTSLNNKRRKILALFRWMQKQHFIQYNPVEEIERFKEIQKPVEFLLAEEMEQLKEGCRTKRDRALLEWMRSTACRRGEVPYVQINQINWGTGELLLYGEKTETWRKVFLDGVALKYIKEYVEKERHLSYDSNQPLFTSLRGEGKALTKSGIYCEIKAIAQRSGLNRRVYPHLLRKTAATNIVRRGGTVDDAGCYIGHKGSDVTRRHYIAQKDPEMVFRLYVASV